MASIELLTSSDLDGYVQSVESLFREDAGTYDEYADTSWPVREGHLFYADLMGQAGTLLLTAKSEGEVVGHLWGLVSLPVPTRDDVSFAVLQSLYVSTSERNRGTGAALVERFFLWGSEAGCVRAVVSAYSNNEVAQRFYRRHGFVAQSLTSTRAL